MACLLGPEAIGQELQDIPALLTARRHYAQHPLDEAVVAPSLDGGPRASAAAMDRAVLLGQIDSCLQAIAPGEDGRRDRLIFWLYYRAGFTASAIG